MKRSFVGIVITTAAGGSGKLEVSRTSRDVAVDVIGETSCAVGVYGAELSKGLKFLLFDIYV